ncbi:hypothetical protein MRB53_012470 [Persea americana]|uniref:Uncharacterized protein n=1 Tax=Persea americana TaxID=3435 RepID=A0ACC2LYB2_PERAE|nr:hypothetical protein MRB53_012470 [Persea americana]
MGPLISNLCIVEIRAIAMKGKRLRVSIFEVEQERSKQIIEVGRMSLWFGSIADIDIEEEQMHLEGSIVWFCLLLGRKR